MGTVPELARHFPIIAIISLILVMIAISYLVQFVLPAMHILRALSSAIERIRHLQASPGATSGSIEEISREMQDREMLRYPWQEYSETLHKRPAPDPSERGETMLWRSTTPAGTFFNEQVLVDIPLKTEFYKHLPGILTGLGIIGTFSGLIVGLIRFEVSGEADMVRSSLNGLIQSVGYSFIVSATAISLAMIFIWAEKSLVTACYGKVENLCRIIDGLFGAGVEKDYLARLVAASETSADQALKTRESLTTDLRQVFTELISRQAKASALLNRDLTENIARGIIEGVREPLERISLSVERANEHQGEAVNRVLSDVMDRCSTQVQGMFGNQLNEALGLLREAAETIRSSAGQITQSALAMQSAGTGAEEVITRRLNTAMDSLEERQKLMDRSMSSFVEQSSQVSSSQTEATRNMQSVLEDIGERMVRIVAQAETRSQHTADELERHQSRLAEQTVAALGDMTDRLGSLAAEMLRVGEATHAGVANLEHITRESSRLFREGTEALHHAFNDFTKASGTAGTSMTAMEKATEELRGASSNLVLATHGVRDMMDEHKHTSAIFADIVSELRSTIENARHEASMTSEIVARIQKATEQLGMAQNMAQEYLHGLTEVLAQAHAEFAGNIELTLRKSNTQFHEELSKAVSLVSGAIQDFGDVLDSVTVKGEEKQCWV